MKAVLCPVCDGKGKVLESITEGHIKAEFDRECHGCLGKGWVEVSDDAYIAMPSITTTYSEYPYNTTIWFACNDTICER